MGEIITFYSYKGGTGRSMALSNVAALTALRESGKKILMIDWDLEAPGIEHYFQKYINLSDLDNKYGIFDFVEKAKTKLPKMIYGKENINKLNTYFSELDKYLIPIGLPNVPNSLYLLKSGKQTDNYSDRINKFNWEGFYNKIPSFFTFFAQYLTSKFDYIFIDARTGHTGIGGISTMLMPEKLVLVYTPNVQGLNGIISVAKKAANYRMNSGDLRPLLIYPLPSRVDERAVKPRAEWRDIYERRFTALFQEIYALPSTISLKNYFDKVQIPHSSEYAFGEKVAVLEETSTINSLSENYRIFAQQLDLEKIWQNEPFSNLEKPFQIFFAFSESDRQYVKELAPQLKVLERQKIIYLKISDEGYLSIDQWDSVIKRNVAEESYDLIISFISNSFLREKSKWNQYLAFKSPEKNIFINIDVNIIPEEIDKYPISPSRRKGVSQMEDRETIWARIVNDIKNKLANYHGSTKQNLNS